jgi:small subunit ribosomal protein S16
MALIIRFRQQGKKNRQTYRLVLVDVLGKRDGKYQENLGWYNPFEKENNAQVNGERVAYWLGKGALISDRAKNLLARHAPDVIKGHMKRQQETRAKRVAQRRAPKKTKAAAK